MTQLDDPDALYWMANLSSKHTGLPFVVWISQRGDARHDVRVMVSRSLKATPSEMVSVAIRPRVRVVEGNLSSADLTLLRKWIKLNQDVLERHWDGDLESTTDAIAAIRPIEG